MTLKYVIINDTYPQATYVTEFDTYEEAKKHLDTASGPGEYWVLMGPPELKILKGEEFDD